MKLKIKFQGPDLIHKFLEKEIPMPKNATFEQECAVDKKRSKLCDKYFEFGDYGAVEVDTVSGTGELVTFARWSKW